MEFVGFIMPRLKVYTKYEKDNDYSYCMHTVTPFKSGWERCVTVKHINGKEYNFRVRLGKELLYANEFQAKTLVEKQIENIKEQIANPEPIELVTEEDFNDALRKKGKECSNGTG